MKINRNQESINKIIKIFLSSIFIIALLPKMFQMLAITLVLLLLCFTSKKIYFMKELTPFWICSIIHLLVIVICICCGHVEINRFLASLNTLLIWVFGYFFYGYVRKNNIKKEELIKAFFFNFIFLLFLSFIFILYKKGSIGLPNFIKNKLMTIDYAYMKTSVRFSGFMEYPNLVPLFSMLVIPFAMEYLENKNIILKFLLLLSIFIPVYLANSRIGIFMALGFIILNFPYLIGKNNKKRKFFIFSLIFILFFGLFIIKHDQIMSSVDKVVYSRADSTSMRKDIYLTSINKTLKESPIFGCGVKTLYKGYPLGSHSTFIGMFYKTGIVGFIIFLIGYYKIFDNLRKLVSKKYLFSFICLTGVLLLEDLDGANWFLILFFIVIGLLNNDVHNQVRIKEDDKNVS